MSASPGTITLLDVTLATAVTAEVHGPYRVAAYTPVGKFDLRPDTLLLLAEIVVAGGGTTAKAWVQSSLDGGAFWYDIASFAFTTASAKRLYHLTNAAAASIVTPTDGALTDNTSVNGLLGSQYRVKLTTTGTYTGASTFKIWGMPQVRA